MTVLAVAVVIPLALALVAADRWDRARRTRRQLVDALAAVPELADVLPAGATEQAAALAAAVARRLGLAEGDLARVVDAVRLRPLADVPAAAAQGAVAAARAVAAVTTESVIPRATGVVLDEALTAPRGRAGQAAAVVRVVDSYVRKLAVMPDSPAGALFATVARHPSGYERRAAEALVHVVQGVSPQLD
ncbi:MAG TPA: hypothetical protein VGB03_06920 [Acidimicrobiales bacterium]